MTTTLTRVQLLVFALVTVLAVGYGAINYFHVGTVIAPSFDVKAQFTSSGGIYPRADVDLLGTRVGSVKKIIPGPGTGTTVVLSLDHGVKIPRDLTAAIGDKSAIGEQYVELTPKSADGPVLAAGDVISKDRTSVPIQVSTLLGDLSSLAGSIPAKDLSTVMSELSTALNGLGPQLADLIDNTDRLTKASLDNVTSLDSLIDDASTVLGTQVAEGPTTASYLRSLGGLTAQLRSIDGSFDALFANGIRAGTQVSNLLADNQAALPVLLNQLVSLTTVANDRIPAIRKTLVVFPYALEVGATGVRRCGSYNPKTGVPVQSTCRYDAQGRPIYSAYLSLQLPLSPTDPYYPCTKGYEGTVKYTPNGLPLKGGAKEKRDSPINMNARCTASPDDPNTPLVRGSQNVPDPTDPTTAGDGRTAPSYGLALYDPASGMVASSDGSYQVNGSDSPKPPTGSAGLGWLMTSPMEGAK
jgi:phospholipid/cholesterol/gamma-HCH transport system substrate-binding protein